MDGQRFDTLAKAFAASTSRRQAIKAGGVGLAASLLGRGRPRPSAAARQCSDAELTVCVTDARDGLGVDLRACAARSRDEGTKRLIESAAEEVLQLPVTGPIIAAIATLIAAIIILIGQLIEKVAEKAAEDENAGKKEQKCVERSGELALKRIDNCLKRQGCPDGTRCCCTDADCADGTTCQGGQCVDRRP